MDWEEFQSKVWQHAGVNSAEICHELAWAERWHSEYINQSPRPRGKTGEINIISHNKVNGSICRERRNQMTHIVSIDDLGTIQECQK